MDRRSWPWKKKSSDKAGSEKTLTALESSGGSLAVSHTIQDIKKPSYIQISLESYASLNGLKDQIKAYKNETKTYVNQVNSMEDQIKILEDKLSTATSDIVSKEELVKQHAKVAEEAVSGWEKAEAEALALKEHLEDATLSKLTVEDRAAHLDSALKECMKQIRMQKEEYEQKLNDVVITKTKQCEKIKLELESRLSSLEQDLLHSAAENAALSRTLQERSSMVISLSEEKSQAEATIEMLKSNIESCEKEINSLKYEVHVVSKELEIRNEEKQMCTKSAEVSNKLHLEGVKKITKLEAECQRLRGLVRKKLPGPQALAQMKLEVENMGSDYVDMRARRYPVKPSNDLLKQNEFLNDRLLAMDDEMRLLQAALAKRDNDLDASRNMFAATASRLQILESQIHASPANDDTTTNQKSPRGTITTIHMELMDDFLEMEKLAYLEADSAGALSCSNSTMSEIHRVDENPGQLDDEVSGVNQKPLQNLQSRISMVFGLNENDIDKVLEGIKCIIQDAEGDLHQESNIVFKEIHCPDTHPQNADIAFENQVSCLDDCKMCGDCSTSMKNDELSSAISDVQKFTEYLGKEASSSAIELQKKIEEFSSTAERVLSGKLSLFHFIQNLSCILSILGESGLTLQGYNGHEEDFNSADCIDKIALPENKSRHSSNISESDPGYAAESSGQACTPSLEELEKIVSERESLSNSLTKYSEALESLKSKLQETENLLASSQRSNGLTETQLKCMVEAYKSLEAEMNALQARTEKLEHELIEERKCHRVTLTRCEELQEEVEKYISNQIDPKSKKEKELEAAAEKLAECQETIFLLSRQLNGLRPSSATDERTGSESPTTPGNLHFPPSEDDADFQSSKSPIRPKHSVHRPTKSSSSSSSTPTPEKQSRSFTRFFSSNARSSC